MIFKKASFCEAFFLNYILEKIIIMVGDHIMINRKGVGDLTINRRPYNLKPRVKTILERLFERVVISGAELLVL